MYANLIPLAAMCLGNVEDHQWFHCACSLGNIASSPAYRTATHIFPVGYQAEFKDPKAGVLVSKIQDGGQQGPAFVVSLSAQDSEPQVLRAR